MKMMRRQWISNHTLEKWLRGPPRFLFMSILGVFLVMQIVYYSIDVHNFSKYYGLRGDFLGKEDFITYLFRMPPRTPSENIIVTIGGDLRYGPNLMKTITDNNASKPLANLKPIFDGSDINFINMDGPVTNSQTKRTCTPAEVQTNRCCAEQCFWKNDPSIIRAFKELGINGIGIENEHMFDYGREGVEDTLYQLKESKIPFTGLGYRTLYRIKDCNVTVLSYNWAYQDDIVFNKVKNIMIYDLHSINSDVFIVIMHGGNQNGGEKTDLQEQFAKAAIDNGAGLVVGTHSRVRQEPENYKDKMIYYGLGSLLDENFLQGTTSFSLLQFEIQQCSNIINLHEIKGKKDTKAMEVNLS